jgi:hypothetical protein
MERKITMGAIKRIFGGGKKKVDPSNDTNKLEEDSAVDKNRRVKLFKTLGKANGEEVGSVKKRKTFGN